MPTCHNLKQVLDLRWGDSSLHEMFGDYCQAGEDLAQSFNSCSMQGKTEAPFSDTGSEDTDSVQSFCRDYLNWGSRPPTNRLWQPVALWPVPAEEIVRSCPLCDRFDYPVGGPNARGYDTEANRFGVIQQRGMHLGEDWNDLINRDRGKPVSAVADGIVVDIRDLGKGWGNIIRIAHNIGNETHPIYIESFYGHMDQVGEGILVGDIVKRGEKIGFIGTGHGAYLPHLHLEMYFSGYVNEAGTLVYETPSLHGYGMPMDSSVSKSFIHPSNFIEHHRESAR